MAMAAEPLPLETALADLQAALKRGDLAGLDALLDRVAQTAAAGIPADAATAARLRAQAAQNDRLLAATLRGLRSARRRLADLRAAKDGFSTYDAAGNRLEHRHDGDGLWRRF